MQATAPAHACGESNLGLLTVCVASISSDPSVHLTGLIAALPDRCHGNADSY
jgi:hypothetical protein